jgi:exosome complex component RRP4
VQALHHDGTVTLHTRSQKYGRLINGHAVAVPSMLIKRQRQHFVSLPVHGVDLILGCNGVVWVAATHAEDGLEGESVLKERMHVVR